MSNYNLNLTGAQIDAALNKVHNADATPVDGSTNVVTSDGVHEAVNNIQFANLNSNLISTDLSSGNNNTTIPTSAAVSSFVAATPANIVNGRCDVTFSADGALHDVTGWGNITNTSLISVSGKDITLPSGTYLILLLATTLGRRYTSGNPGIIRFYKDGTQIGAKCFLDSSSRPTDLALGGIHGGGVYHCHIDDQRAVGGLVFNAIKLA